MSNLTRLQAVSSSLDAAINKAESLPEVGSGSSGTVSVTISNIDVCGFDADGNSLSVTNETYNFLSDIVEVNPTSPYQVSGTYVRNGTTLYKFFVDGGEVYSSSNGGNN